jgi:nucleotide-binding universal stress UspA family protein
MARRILLVLSPNDDGLSATRDVAALARATGGKVRVMYVHPVPQPRVDRYDHMVADVDQEMARVTTVALARLQAWTAGVRDVAIEAVIRFGRLGREVAIEAGVFRADLVALARPERRSLRHRLRAWYLERIALENAVPLGLVPMSSAALGRDAAEASVVARFAR